MAYTVYMLPAAVKALTRLPVADQLRIRARINSLADHPLPHGSTKLAGADDLYRIRAGDYRIIYRVQHGRLIVLIIRIGHRREVYRDL